MFNQVITGKCHYLISIETLERLAKNKLKIRNQLHKNYIIMRNPKWKLRQNWPHLKSKTPLRIWINIAYKHMKKLFQCLKLLEISQITNEFQISNKSWND